MEISVNIAQFGGSRRLAVVVGHERSGNHFLMNAIAEVCGYTVSPYLDFDHADVNINFHHAETLADVLRALGRPPSGVAGAGCKPYARAPDCL